MSSCEYSVFKFIFYATGIATIWNINLVHSHLCKNALPDSELLIHLEAALTTINCTQERIINSYAGGGSFCVNPMFLPTSVGKNLEFTLKFPTHTPVCDWHNPWASGAPGVAIFRGTPRFTPHHTWCNWHSINQKNKCGRLHINVRFLCTSDGGNLGLIHEIPTPWVNKHK